VAAQLTQVGLEVGRHLVRAVAGSVGAVGQGVQAAGPIAAQPAVDGLAADPVAVGDLDHGEPVAQDLHDGVEALFCHGELQEHAPDLLARRWSAKHKKLGRWCQPSTGTPEPISRNQPVKHQRISTGVRTPGYTLRRNWLARQWRAPLAVSVNTR
jgi:hypothetical protein